MRTYHLRLDDSYTENDKKIIEKYSPFEFIKSEYFNYGYGDSGYYVYIKVDPKMKNEDWDKNTFMCNVLKSGIENVAELYESDLINYPYEDWFTQEVYKDELLDDLRSL
jgi:hypothetical protein